MTIENRFAQVTVHVPVEKFMTEEGLNVWSPSDWPQVIADSAKTHLQEAGFEVIHAKMEGAVYQPESYTYYVVWHTMGTMVAQYLELPNDPPTVKQIQDLVEEFNQAVFLTMQQSDQPLKEPPTDTLIFFFARVGGRQNDAIPKPESGTEGKVVGTDEVAEQGGGGELQPRKRRISRIN